MCTSNHLPPARKPAAVQLLTIYVEPLGAVVNLPEPLVFTNCTYETNATRLLIRDRRGRVRDEFYRKDLVFFDAQPGTNATEETTDQSEAAESCDLFVLLDDDLHPLPEPTVYSSCTYDVDPDYLQIYNPDGIIRAEYRRDHLRFMLADPAQEDVTGERESR